MAKIILLCGKLCAGKTRYAQQLRRERNALVFSCDELMLDVQPEGDFDLLVARASRYLLKKALETVACGVDAVMDLGYWKREQRSSMSEYLRAQGVSFEWHFVDISDDDWRANIAERNQAVLEGRVSAYYVDEGLMQKMLGLFEAPDASEMDVWFISRRESASQ